MSNAGTDVELQHAFTELGDGSRPFFDSPGFCEEAGLWFYGNMNLLSQRLEYVEESLLPPPHATLELNALNASRASDSLWLPPSTIFFSPRRLTICRAGALWAPNGSIRSVMVLELGNAGPPAGSVARKTFVRCLAIPV